MKRLFTIALTAFALCGTSFAQELTGYDIMKKADDIENANTSSYTATMTLTGKKGNTRVREVIMKSKDYGETEKSVIVFTTPKDVAGVAYLMFEYDDRPDGTTPDSDSWLYMPAMKKSRRITGSGKEDDFMGSDFTYEDMGERGLSKDIFTLIKEEDADGFKCYVVQAESKDKTEKEIRRLFWIREDNFVTVKAEFYDKQDMLRRTLNNSDIKQIDGYWTTGKMLIKNVQTEHTTLLEMKDVKYDLPLDDNLFTVASLERGAVR